MTIARWIITLLVAASLIAAAGSPLQKLLSTVLMPRALFGTQ
jgi:hypothetical protein